MSWNPVRALEIKFASEEIVNQIKKWGPTAVAVAGSVAAFLLPSVQHAVKAHPADLGWAILYAVVTHLLPSPVAKS